MDYKVTLASRGQFHEHNQRAEYVVPGSLISNVICDFLDSLLAGGCVHYAHATEVKIEPVTPSSDSSSAWGPFRGGVPKVDHPVAPGPDS